MLNIIGSILIAAFAGGFYYRDDNKVLAVICIILAYLIAIDYFNPDRAEKDKKSVM